MIGTGNATSRPQPDLIAMQDIDEGGSDAQQQITYESTIISCYRIVLFSVHTDGE